MRKNKSVLFLALMAAGSISLTLSCTSQNISAYLKNSTSVNTGLSQNAEEKKTEETGMKVSAVASKSKFSNKIESENTEEATEHLTDTQHNSINMLNYLTVLTQEINSSKNSKLYLEQAYSSIVNNT